MQACFTSIWQLVRNISSCLAYFENPSNVGRKVQTYTLCRLFVNTSLGCNWWIYLNSLRFEKSVGYLHNWKKETYACSTSTRVLSVTSKPVICCHICRSLTEGPTLLIGERLHSRLESSSVIKLQSRFLFVTVLPTATANLLPSSYNLG